MILQYGHDVKDCAKIFVISLRRVHFVQRKQLP